MKKRILSFVLLFVVMISPNFTQVESLFRVNYSERTTEYVDGVRHTKLVAKINYDGTETDQIINYLGANISTQSDLNIVVGDNYQDYGWGRGDLNTIIYNVNERYPNYNVIGGVNGDFYSATGYPVEAYVRNFEVLSPGLGYERTVIGFLDNGETVFGRPEFSGYELLVFNSDGALKLNVPIEGINKLPTTDDDVTVYFENKQELISGDLNKVVISASEIKIDDWGTIFFGKGELNYQTNEELLPPLQGMVIVGKDFNDNELITPTDYVVVQQHIGGDFEGVRFAIGAWEKLVKDGVATEYYSEGAGPTYRHPRTAIGIKEDGTVFFITVDGRDYINGYLGVTAYELAEIMLYFDAVEAYNLDGGGSTAMSLINDDGEYIYLNNPSDGAPRAVANGLFFVRGEHIPVLDKVPFPDLREVLNAPANVYVDDEGILNFDEVLNSSSYIINIDGVDYDSFSNQYQLDQTPGTYNIMIKARGNQLDYKDSQYTEVIIYTVYSENMQKFIDLFIKYTQSETSD